MPFSKFLFVLLFFCEISQAMETGSVCDNSVDEQEIRSNYCQEYSAGMLKNSQIAKAGEGRCQKFYFAALNGMDLICQYFKDAEARAGQFQGAIAQEGTGKAATAEDRTGKINKISKEDFDRYHRSVVERLGEIQKVFKASKELLLDMEKKGTKLVDKESRCNSKSQAGEAPGFLLMGLARSAGGKQKAVHDKTTEKLFEFSKLLEANFAESDSTEHRANRLRNSLRSASRASGEESAAVANEKSIAASAANRALVQGATPLAGKLSPEIAGLLKQATTPIPGTGAKIPGGVVVGTGVSLSVRLAAQGKLDAGDLISIGVGAVTTVFLGPGIGVPIGVGAEVVEKSIRNHLARNKIAFQKFVSEKVKTDPGYLDNRDSAALSEDFLKEKKTELCEGAPLNPDPQPGIPL